MSIFISLKPADIMELEGDSEQKFAIADLTKRQLLILIAHLAMTEPGSARDVPGGYELYSEIFDAALDKGFLPSDLSPYKIFTDTPSPYPQIEAAADLAVLTAGTSPVGNVGDHRDLLKRATENVAGKTS